MILDKTFSTQKHEREIVIYQEVKVRYPKIYKINSQDSMRGLLVIKTKMRKLLQ